MNGWRMRIVSGLALAACSVAQLQAGEPAVLGHHPVAEVSALMGSATVTHAGQHTAVPLAVSDVLFERDRIVTPAASKVRIRFADDTTVTVGELANLELTAAKVTRGKDGRQTTLTMTSGWFRASVQRLMEHESFALRTPTAVGAVRGTEFGAVLKPGATGIFVKQGTVSVTNQDTAVQGAVLLRDGDGTDVVPGQPPTAPKQWRPERVAELMTATTIP